MRREDVSVELAEFGGFKRDRRAMAEWVASRDPEMVVMESTGIYWKSPYAALEKVGIVATVVNARHVKTVPGRKTDWSDAQWLATLARSGLLRASFVPPAKLRELRHVARQRQQLVGILSGEKNRVHKLLSDGGIRLSVVVSDIHGVAGRAMVKALIEGQPPAEVLMLAGNRLKADRQELLDALDGELTAEHRFVLRELMAHVEELEQRIDRFDLHLLEGAGALSDHAGADADHPRHRRHWLRLAARRDRRQHGCLRIGRSPGLLGRYLSWQQRVRRKTKVRADPKRQSLGPTPALPVRSRG
jgi:transposase